MATYLIAGGTCVVAVALVPTVARILSKVLPANDKPGTPPVREAGKTSGFKKVTHDSAANVVKLETNAKGTTCGHIVPWELPKKYCELVAENIKKAK